MFAIKRWYRKHKLEIIVTSILGIMIAIILIRMSVETIRPGQEGVRWERFFDGTRLDRSYDEGTHFIFPWDHMYLYNMRLQELSSSFDVLAKNGVYVDVEVTFHYRPMLKNLPMLHKYIGPEYVNILILPKIGSHVRELFAEYEPEQLFSLNRPEIEKKLLENIKHEVMDRDLHNGNDQLMQYVAFENIFITRMVLPERVVKAIEHKEATKQTAMAYSHRLEIEKKEKLRKKIEAEGIRDFQSTINEGISDKYLAWKGIEATLELAQSDNAKVVVIGSAKDGLPIILGGEYTSSNPKPKEEPDPDDEIAHEMREPITAVVAKAAKADK